jgi:hypothetical protein
MVYVDGYNLYYGCLKDTSERWLDVGKLCAHMLRDDTEIAGIRYFTALVKSRPDNPGQRHRQQTYFRALRTIPNLTMHLGVFLEKTATRLRADNRSKKPTYVKVLINEEKGSDVNLASYLLIDNFRARYDLAVVISNDGDLKLPVNWLRYEHKLPVGVLNPHGNRSLALSPRELPTGSFYKPIRRTVLRASQFPDMVPDAKGIISKPSGW